MTLRWLPIVLLASGCASEPTQLVVVVETNLDVPAEMDAVAVAVTGPSGVSTATSEMLVGPDDPPFPLTVSVVPSGEALGPITIVARALSSGDEVVRAEVRTSLVEGRSKVVRLYLLRGCIDRPCDGMTCGLEGCVPVDVASEDLPAWTEGMVEPTDLDDPCVSDPWDQDGDGQGAEACGGTDCDDMEERAYEGNVEECDMVDNDCDGARDEDCSCTPEGIVEDCPTRCGSTGTHMCSGGVWTPCVAEEICSGSDTDCDDITDEGFAYVEGMRHQLTNTNFDSAEPHMVFADGRFAIAWIDRTRLFRNGVFFMTVDETGDPGGSMPQHVDDDANEPRLAWDGTSFGVTWYDPDSVSCGTDCTRTDRRVRFTTIDAGGMRLSDIEELDDAAANPVMPRIAWTGSEYGIAYNDNDVYLHRAEAGGAVLGGRVSVDDQMDGLDMIHTGASYAFLFADNDDVRFNIGTPGTFMSPSPVIHSGNNIEYPALVETETGFFATWADRGGEQVQIATLDDRGELVRTPEPLAIPRMRNRRSIRPQLAAGRGQVFVVFRAEDDTSGVDVYMARFTPDGTELQPPTPISTPDDQFWPTPAWGADRLGIAYVDQQTGDDQLWFTTFACP